MPPVTPTTPQRRLVVLNDLRSFFGFGLIGAANVILPFIIYSSSYLIIPYSRPIVILIETLPALAVKILLPQGLHILPTRFRPCLLATCWCLAALITADNPPNSSALPRIAVVALASAASATAEVSFLTQTRHYGRSALAGWGSGTGIGGTVSYLIPIMVSRAPKFLLRSTIIYVYHIVVLLLVGYFLVLPQPILTHTGRGRDVPKSSRSDIGDEEVLINTEFQLEEPAEVLTTTPHRNFLGLTLVRPFVHTLIIPLLTAFLLQSYISPATARLQPKSETFRTFSDFQVAFAFAVQFGSLISRSTTLLLRKKTVRLFTRVSQVSFAILFFNSILALVSNDIVLLLLASCVGLGSGAVYIATYAGLTDQLQDSEPVAGANFAFGAVSAGETGGILVGSMLGSAMERIICASAHGHGRWCSSTR